MSTEKKTEKHVEVQVPLTEEQIKARNTKAYFGAKDAGIKLVHNPEFATEAQFMAALDGYRKETGKLERAEKYLKQAQEAANKVKEHQLVKQFHYANYQKQSQSRIDMAQMTLEMYEAILTGQKPVDNTESIEREKQLGLNQAKIAYVAARPDSSDAKKTNLENLEKSRQQAVDAEIITGKECPKFATEQDGEWVVATMRQKMQPRIEDTPQPQLEQQLETQA